MDDRSAFFAKVREFHEANPPAPAPTRFDAACRGVMWAVILTACLFFPGLLVLVGCYLAYQYAQEWD